MCLFPLGEDTEVGLLDLMVVVLSFFALHQLTFPMNMHAHEGSLFPISLPTLVTCLFALSLSCPASWPPPSNKYAKVVSGLLFCISKQ